jgi:hypothetical protein
MALDTNSSLESWKALCRSRKREDRLIAAETMPHSEPFRSVKMSVSLLLSDEDEGVRAEAADSIGWFRGKAVLELLKHRLSQEKSNFVKVYLLNSIRALSTGSEVQVFQSVLPTRDANLRVEAYLGMAVASLTEAVRELNRSVSADKGRRVPSHVIRRFESGFCGILNRLGDGVVDIRKFAADGGQYESEREVARSAAEFLLAEFRHVLGRIKLNEYGVSIPPVGLDD